jgi:hypothetical protein
MKQLPEGNTKVNAFGNVGLRWAQSDPKAALAWAQQLPEGPAKDRALRDIIGTAWALRDPKAAVEFASTLPSGGSRDVVMSDIARRWAGTDPLSASQWLAALPDDQTNPGQRYRLIEDVARGWLQSDPAKAAAWLATTSLPADRKQQLLQKR